MSWLPRRVPRFFRHAWFGRLARLIVMAVAVWLMAAPSLFDYQETAAADSDRIVGPIAGALAFVALWDVLVALRWLTLPCGLWLIVAPLFLDAGTTSWTVSTTISGLLIASAAAFGPDVRVEFDGGWTTVAPSRWSSPTESG